MIAEDDFIHRGCAILGIDIEDIRSRGRGQEIVVGRELFMVLGVERYNLKVKKLAVQLARSSAGMSKALARGIQKRRGETAFSKKLDDLDQRIALNTLKV